MGVNMARRTVCVVMVLAALVSAALLLGGCGAETSEQRSVPQGEALNQPIPARAAAVPLVDQRGRRFTLRSLRGKVVILAPLLTMCQETCPMTSANMHHAAEALRARGLSDKVVLLELSVDPERDTVRRMRVYASLYGSLPDWRLATGRPHQVRFLWKELGVSTAKTPEEGRVRDWLSGRQVPHPYDVQHQDVVLGLAADGRLRWLTVGRPDARTRRLPAAIREFLNHEGRQNYRNPSAHGASTWSASDIGRAFAYVRGLD
jgi:cytochrome oxidase Cu insertion factor (SCO1/SenC/PrrC family)